jgi:hypothetical protein
MIIAIIFATMAQSAQSNFATPIEWIIRKISEIWKDEENQPNHSLLA